MSTTFSRKDYPATASRTGLGAVPVPGAGRPRGFFGTIARAYGHAMLRAELHSLSDRDLADIGLSRSQIDAIRIPE